MSRFWSRSSGPLRSKDRESAGLPVAAEVLESRSLLSATSALVHGALHQAHQAANEVQAVANSPAAQTNLSVTAQFTTLTPLLGSPDPLSGQLSISTIKRSVGARFSAHLSISQNVPGGLATITGTFSGKVLSLTPGLDELTLTLAPGRNSIVEKIKGPTGTHVESARTDGSPMTLNVDGTGAFFSLELVDLVPNSSPLRTFDLLCSIV